MVRGCRAADCRVHRQVLKSGTDFRELGEVFVSPRATSVSVPGALVSGAAGPKFRCDTAGTTTAVTVVVAAVVGRVTAVATR